jgi:D-alanine--poly(phosphoribitol) ligase subunit 2|tara:strand:- start:53 stop:337 length:285 start_codon:yes stop_codon:yes gene_type:complete
MKILTKIVINGLKEIDQKKYSGELGLNTAIFGNKGALDSLGLVTLLVNIEQKIESHYNTSITIADEKAMSLSNSPFKTIGSLIDYINRELNKNE